MEAEAEKQGLAAKLNRISKIGGNHGETNLPF